MSRSVAMALLGAAAAVGVLQACTSGAGREDVALQRLLTRLCEKQAECGCGPLYDDLYGKEPAECGDQAFSGYESDFDAGNGRTLAFDPSCVERWTSWVDELSCLETPLPSYAELCPLYHGTLREGEACERDRDLLETTCDRGLFCVAETCRDPRRTSFGAEGEPCDIGGICDHGLGCDDSLCRRVPGVGERCDDGECQPGAYCSFDPNTGESLCLRAGEVGGPCSGHGQCVSGNCPAGYCEDPAGAGDPCGSQLPCGPDTFCRGGQCQDEGVSEATCSLLGAL